MKNTTMQRISRWGKIVGIVMLVIGLLDAFAGLFAFIVGAIPGLITAYLGYVIYKTGKSADEYINSQSEESVHELLDNYAKYLLIQGILLIVSVILVVVMFMVFGAAMFSAFGSM